MQLARDTFVSLLGPPGFLCSFYKPTDARLFVITYVLVGAYFSAKMIRLVLLLSPGACVVALAGREAAGEPRGDVRRVRREARELVGGGAGQQAEERVPSQLLSESEVLIEHEREEQIFLWKL